LKLGPDGRIGKRTAKKARTWKFRAPTISTACEAPGETRRLPSRSTNSCENCVVAEIVETDRRSFETRRFGRRDRGLRGPDGKNGVARKWRRNGLKRLNPRSEMVWPQKPRSHNIWYTGPPDRDAGRRKSPRCAALGEITRLRSSVGSASPRKRLSRPALPPESRRSVRTVGRTGFLSPARVRR
jgi:hypothetical protein